MTSGNTTLDGAGAEAGVTVDKEQILSIVQEVFSAMLDAGEVLVFESDPHGESDNDLYAWVDMHMVLPMGDLSARAVVRTEAATANVITQSLLMMDPSEEVSTEDLADAFGEIANVVGGNVKSLIDVPASLSLPSVSAVGSDALSGTFLQDIDLNWRGMPLNVSLWILTDATEWS